MNEAKKLANTIGKNSQNAVTLSKKAINQGIQVDIESGIKIEEELFGNALKIEIKKKE
jgi:enoyl-CoA hydratase